VELFIVLPEKGIDLTTPMVLTNSDEYEISVEQNVYVYDG